MSKNSYDLTKQETDKISSIASQVSFYQQLLNTLQDGYRYIIVNEIFKRLEIKPEKLTQAQIQIDTGKLIIQEPKDE